MSPILNLQTLTMSEQLEVAASCSSCESGSCNSNGGG